jgi:cytochrome c-type biogenesis protein CcmE
MSNSAAKYARFGVAIAIIVLALGYLAFTGVQESKSYYVTIGELKGMGDSAYSKRLKVAGNVVPGSIKRKGTHLEFALLEATTPDGKPAIDANAPGVRKATIGVEYTGTEAPPDTFRDESQALVEGSYGRDGVFHAKQIQAKCASKYEPAQQAAGSGAASGAPAAAGQVR